MPVPNLFIRCTHSGVFPSGLPNEGPILIPDLDVGYEYQNRKVPCYVPRWANHPTNTIPGFISIPASSRSMLSYASGAIKKAADVGLITAVMIWQPESYTTLNLPPASNYPAGAMVWDSTTQSPVYSNGTSWSLSALNPSVASYAALSALDVTLLASNTTRNVLSNLSQWHYDATSTLAIDGETVLATSGVGRWLRDATLNPIWTHTASWTIDSVAGNDENHGTVGSPIKTWREWLRRTWGQIAQATTVDLVGTTWPASDPITGMIQPVNPQLPNALTINGTKGVARTGTVLTATNPAPATTGAATITDVAVVAWTVGAIIYVPSTGVTAVVMKDMGGGTARVTQWMEVATINETVAPLAGVSYQVLSMTEVQGETSIRPGPGAVVALRFLRFAGYVRPESLFLGFVACQFATASWRTDGSWSFVSLGCAFGKEGYVPFSPGNFVSWYDGFFNDVFMGGCGTMVFLKSVFQGGLGTYEGGFCALYGHVGFYDFSYALWAYESSTIDIVGEVYGSGITGKALDIKSCGKVLIGSTDPVPHITGGTQLSLDGSATQIPPLTAGAVVPAASACSTFAQWAAAPFNKRVISRLSGAAFVVR